VTDKITLLTIVQTVKFFYNISSIGDNESRDMARSKFTGADIVTRTFYRIDPWPLKPRWTRRYSCWSSFSEQPNLWSVYLKFIWLH